MTKRPSRHTTLVFFEPGSDWFMIRGKKLLSAWNVNLRGGRIGIGLWKELPRARGDRQRRWQDGHEMRLTPEEALDLGYALGFMAYQADPDVRAKHCQWKSRGRRRVSDAPPDSRRRREHGGTLEGYAAMVLQRHRLLTT